MIPDCPNTCLNGPMTVPGVTYDRHCHIPDGTTLGMWYGNDIYKDEGGLNPKGNILLFYPHSSMEDRKFTVLVKWPEPGERDALYEVWKRTLSDDH